MAIQPEPAHPVAYRGDDSSSLSHELRSPRGLCARALATRQGHREEQALPQASGQAVRVSWMGWASMTLSS